MYADPTAVEARAAFHAALADPGRLRIVDLLTLGDLSPTELQEQLGMSSNLLAHHLKLLEQRGMVVRVRSQADRRRSYVRLVPEAFENTTPSRPLAARRVAFVCTANSARSQLAAALWRRSSPVPAASAGTHPAPAVAAGAIAVAARHGIALGGTAPAPVEDVVQDTDLVVTVCDNAHEELGPGGIHWSVPDPVRIGSDSAFESAYQDIERRIAGLAERLTLAAS